MRICIEADSIASERMSGIGHATLEMVRQLDSFIEGTSHQLIIIVPFGRKKFLAGYNLKNASIRQLPPGYRYVNYALTRTSLPFAADLLYGRGVYIFPNYKNWYVPFSTSLTFVHDIAFKLFPETVHPKNLTYLNDNFDRWMARTDKIATISNQSKSEIRQEFPYLKDKVETVHLGVDKSEYMPMSYDDIKPVLDKYGLKDDYFITVGNIEPRKNINTLLGSYKAYSDSVSSPAQLVLVGGDGWKNEDTLRRINTMQEQGYAVFRPDRYVQDDDLPALYSGARANIHVAIHEGFGLPPVQAQACGTPVIASNLPVFREILDPSITTYVSPAKPQDIANAMACSLPWTVDRRTTPKDQLTWANTVRELIRFIGIME